MKITVIGTGYVGLVSSTCLADVGNDVLCLDLDAGKIRMLDEGRIPIYEPGLEAMVRRNQAAGRLRFTTDVAAAVAHGRLQFIAVGTPPGEDGSADLQYVLAAARNIGRHMDGYKLVVNKSTVPVGTADQVRGAIAGELATRGAGIAFSVVSNPEFLKEGAAIDDFMKPDRIVVGADEQLRMRVDGKDSATLRLADLAARVTEVQAGNANTPVVISADRNVKYETVVKTMDVLQRAGVQRVGLSVKQGAP